MEACTLKISDVLISLHASFQPSAPPATAPGRGDQVARAANLGRNLLPSSGTRWKRNLVHRVPLSHISCLICTCSAAPLSPGTTISETQREAFRATMNGSGFQMTEISLNPVMAHKLAASDESLVLVHTIFVPPFSKSLAFFRDVSRISKQLHALARNPRLDELGPLLYLLEAKPLRGAYDTISVWRSLDVIRKFYTSGAHSASMKEWKADMFPGVNYLTTRFEVKPSDLPLPGGSVTEAAFWAKTRQGKFPTHATQIRPMRS
eukprot:TRINITY_DN1588_c0_g2_i1.p1 TRINITY_DN1588_c0_g2~~TRINITY_DN1588_c0_g2_i1.p1  ORF type:complete len:263 (-),score=13.39 TRINITY_DN1588_c0_g2_i1:1531-2319(-)